MTNRWNWKRSMRPLMRTLLNWYIKPKPVALSFEYEIRALGLLSRVTRIGPIERGFCTQRSDSTRPGLTHRHAFTDRQLFLLREAVFASKTGQIYVRGHLVRESRPDAVPKPRGSELVARVKRRLPATPVAVSRQPWNYYHWILEDLPTILRAQEAQAKITVFLGNRPPKFVTESLEILGIQFEVTRVNLRFEELLLPTRGDDAKWHRKQDLDRLRDAFSAQISEPLGRRLYISRRFSSRCLSNEELVEGFLSQIGFEIIYAERLSVAQQVKVFSEAEIVVGNHGAGLSNVVFGPAQQFLLELSSLHNMNDCFRGLAQAQGKPYHRVVCAPGKWMDQSELTSSGLSELAARINEYEKVLPRNE